MKTGYGAITALLGGALAAQLAMVGVYMSSPAFWTIFGTALAMGGVFYKWGDEL
ncbi:hypothetical protein [Pseudomonas juntendi]|uniref:Uncharacterized protein n=1 Tax=Pseudomonas juntendi TaxID=2666183 RepID=A0A7W2PS90_9PSED|nr:hypothetical protein [Pseudomonas juntendi]MBA6058970.1 hypothetical protein [Pseudomonas juntendi]MBA6126052.1 hypothetical protein [Pseudomonas juntendi]